MDYRDIYNEWLNSDALTDCEKKELTDIKNDDNAIKERFAAALAFGTAGMRGILGAGTNRMNVHTVARATFGLAEYIKERGPKDMERGVVISYDTRHMSPEFAIVCAEVLNDCGITAYIFENVRPVPFCSFAVRRLNAVAGIMITASHNPKIYNGYKVYGEDGAQMSPEDTAVVVKHIESLDAYFKPYKKTGLAPEDIKNKDGANFQKVKVIGKTLDEEYFEAVQKLMLSPEAVAYAKNKIKIVYTPIHGSGCMPVTEMLKRMDIPFVTVPEQVIPDPDFPTVRVPNPEESDALTMAVALADKIGGNVVIGTDPDCDRMGVAVRDNDGKLVLLNGNQTGVLLMDYILSRNYQKGTLPSNSAVVKTIVTTKLADKVAETYNTAVFDVLTGFKYIGEKIKEWEATGEYTYMFGFEESYGSLCGTHARDKDAVVASMLFAEMACYLESSGSSVFNRLCGLYAKYGYYLERAFSFAFNGLDGMEKMAALMSRVTALRPTSVAGDKVLYISDYNAGVTYFSDGGTDEITLPKTNAVYYGLENDGWLCIRPSGTEPKLKIYLAAAESSRACAESKLDLIKSEIIKLFNL